MALAVLLLFGAVIPASAAAKPALALSVLKYDAASGGYVKTSTVLSGDLLMVEVAVEGTVASVAALRLKLAYDGAHFQYVANSAVPALEGGTPTFTNKYNSQAPENSYLNAYWIHETPSHPLIAENVTGRLVTFLFQCTGSAGTAEFSLQVTEAYNKFYKPIAFAADTVQTPVTIQSWALEPETKSAFEKLLHITYPNSKADIEAADALFGAFTAAEQLQFKSGYPELFQAYKAAWIAYYDAAQNAVLQDIQKEIEAFKQANASDLAVLKTLTPDTLSEQNYKSVLNVQSAYQKLSVQAQSHMDADIKAQLNRLRDLAKNIQIALEDRQLADEAANDFITLYQNLWGLDEATVRESVSSEGFEDLVVTAAADYGNLAFDQMSAAVKTRVEPYGKCLDQYIVWIKDQLEKNGEDSKVLDEVLAFTTKWSKALKLNPFTVGLGDESALQYLLEDYATLSPAAQQRLLSAKNTAQQLLGLIEGLKQTQKDTDTEIIVVPENPPAKPTEIVREQIVEVPVETVKTKTQVQLREIPQIVKVMALFMCIGILSLALPAALYLVYRKKRNAAEGNGAE